MTSPFVSILLLTHNGAETLPETLDAIAKQRASFTFETVAVDSGSVDGTLDLLRRRVNRVVEIPPGQFNHGLTRNYGVEQCRGELIVLLVQDALPGSETWLEELVAPLTRDATVAGSFARQIPRPAASAVTRYYAERWIAFDTKPRVAAVRSEDEWRALSPMERYLTCVFDNVCSCIRRAVWQQHPFKATPIAEDLEWAMHVLLAGYRLAFTPSASVIHSHERNPRYELDRTYLVHQRLRALFGVKTISNPLKLVGVVAVTMAAHVRCLAGRHRPGIREITRALALGLALPLGQYLGALSYDRSWQILRPQGL